MDIQMILIGVSSGATNALRKVLSPLPSDFQLPIVIVCHQVPDADNYIIRLLERNCHLKIKYAEQGEKPIGNVVYLAPPDRHLRFTQTGCFELLTTPKIHFCRPSVDILFISAAEIFGSRLVGVILTGANQDGAAGLKAIQKRRGLTIVQNPKSAESKVMPEEAIRHTPVDYIIWLDQIGPFLWDLQQKSRKAGL